MQLHDHISLHIPSHKTAGPYLAWRQKKLCVDHTIVSYCEWFDKSEFHVRFGGTGSLYA